ncbi:MAG: AAA family ATPase, partial [Gammaproteobacteria bacterium]
MINNYELTTGADNFRELVSTDQIHIDPNKLFVDKTLFIKDFFDSSGKVLLITRPRRWGKTLALSMLQHFLSKEVEGLPTAGLFENLKINEYLVDDSKYKKYQGSFPVILVSFKDLNGDDYSQIEQRIKKIFSRLYREFKYLVDGSV